MSYSIPILDIAYSIPIPTVSTNIFDTAKAKETNPRERYG